MNNVDDFIVWAQMKEPTLTESSIPTLIFYYNELAADEAVIGEKFPSLWRKYLYNVALHEAIFNSRFYPTSETDLPSTELQALYVLYGCGENTPAIFTGGSGGGTSTSGALGEQVLQQASVNTHSRLSTPYGQIVEGMLQDMLMIVV